MIRLSIIINPVIVFSCLG